MIQATSKFDTFNMIQKIRDKFNFIIIDDQTFYKMAVQASLDAKNEWKQNTIKEFRTLLNIKLTDALTNYVQAKIQAANPITIINRFINKNLMISSNIQTCIKELNKLNQFLINYELNMTFEDSIELIHKNRILRTYLKAFSKIDISFMQNDTLQMLMTAFATTEYSIDNETIDEETNISSNDYNFDTNLIKEYMKDLENKPLLTKAEFETLFYKYKKGDIKAKKTLIERNLKLVIAASKQYKGRGLEFLDIIQEGNLGLMNALEKFDIAKGYSFSTYAIIWIHQKIKRAIAQKSRNIKLSVGTHLEVRKFMSTKNVLSITLDREPTIEEIAKKMGISIGRARYLEPLQYDTVSLSTIVIPDDDIELSRYVVDDSDFVEDNIMVHEKQHQVLQMLDKCNLTQREKEIICYRYGLNGKKFLVYEDMKNIFNLSRSRIAQIEENALLKIRRSSYIKTLAVFMDSPEQSLKYLESFQKQKKKSKQS